MSANHTEICRIVKAHEEAMACFRMIQPSMARDLTLSVLFLKYVSDHRVDQLNIPPHGTFGALFQQRRAAHLAELFHLAFEELASLNAQHLGGVFKDVNFAPPYPDDRDPWLRSLRELLEIFNPLKISDPSFLNKTYEHYFDLSAARQTGSFFTPSQIGDLLAGLLKPKPGDTICDPTCGTGNLLVSCGRYLRRKGGRPNRLFGQEVSLATWRVARLNLLLHGMGGHLEAGDTILKPRLTDQHGDLLKFNVVVGNPPFSVKRWGAELAGKDGFNRFHRGVPHQNRGDLAFVSHMVETMETEKGRAGIILPYGPLTRKGREGEIRLALLEENLVDAVIGLPPKLFLGTHAVALLVLKKGRKENNVLFINASEEAVPDGNRNRLTTDGMERVLSAMETRLNEGRFARRVPREGIDPNTSLDPRHYTELSVDGDFQ